MSPNNNSGAYPFDLIISAGNNLILTSNGYYLIKQTTIIDGNWYWATEIDVLLNNIWYLLSTINIMF